MTCIFLCLVLFCGSLVSVVGFCIFPAHMSGPPPTLLRQQRIRPPSSALAVRVWIEEAEDGFVDEEENLEDDEMLIKALKAFASNPDDPDEKKFLCAGALVQRQYSDPGMIVCDAWMADAIMEAGEGGPNLQIQGAIRILDELFLHHLSLDNADERDRAFVVQCGTETSVYTCASYRAALARGFRPVVDVDFDDPIDEARNDDIEDGMMFDFSTGVERYTDAAKDDHGSPQGLRALEILSFLSSR